MRRQSHLSLVLEVVQDCVKVFIYSPSARSLAVVLVVVAVGRRGEGTIVCNRQAFQIDWNAARASSGIRGVDGRGIIDDAHAAVGGSGIILKIFESIHGEERGEVEEQKEKREARAEGGRQVSLPKPCPDIWLPRGYLLTCHSPIPPIVIPKRLRSVDFASSRIASPTARMAGLRSNGRLPEPEVIANV